MLLINTHTIFHNIYTTYKLTTILNCYVFMKHSIMSYDDIFVLVHYTSIQLCYYYAWILKNRLLLFKWLHVCLLQNYIIDFDDNKYNTCTILCLLTTNFLWHVNCNNEWMFGFEKLILCLKTINITHVKCFVYLQLTSCEVCCNNELIFGYENWNYALEQGWGKFAVPTTIWYL